MQPSSSSHKDDDERRALVWPGIQALSPQYRQQGTPPARPAMKPRFSFDWTRRDGKADQSLSGMLAGWGEGGKQREGAEPYNRQKTLDEESFNTLPASIRSRVPFATVQQAFTIMSSVWAEGNKKMVSVTFIPDPACPFAAFTAWAG